MKKVNQIENNHNLGQEDSDRRESDREKRISVLENVF